MEFQGLFEEEDTKQAEGSIGMESSWKKQFGWMPVRHKSSRNLVFKSWPPGNLHKISGSLEGIKKRSKNKQHRNNYEKGYILR